MGDVAKGIRSFRKGLSEVDSEEKPEASPKIIDGTKTSERERDVGKTG